MYPSSPQRAGLDSEITVVKFGTVRRFVETFYFTVDDIEAAQKRVIDAGGKILLPPMDVPGGSRILQAVDDQGCNFALMQGPKS